MRPKLLFVTSVWPLGDSSGGQQRTLNICKLLSEFVDISLAIAPSEQKDDEIVRRTEREFHVGLVAHWVPVSKRNPIHSLHSRLQHEFNPVHLETIPWTVSESDRSALLRLINEHDLTWVHTVKTANIFRLDRWPMSVLDIDDIPSRVYAASAAVEQNPIRRLLDLRMSRIWRRRERHFSRRFDVLTVCSEDDRRYLGNQARIHVIPNGYEVLGPHRRMLSDPPRIGFIGNFTWSGNSNGIEWFIRRVWPRIKEQVPRLELRLIGRGSDGEVAKLGRDVEGLGFVEDPGPEIASWSAMVVPIKFGGGTRVKTVEGFARRCPIVATSIGAFGYDVRHGEEVMLADSPEDFASCCVSIVRNPELGDALAQRAHNRFLREWAWDSYKDDISRVIEDVLGTAVHQMSHQD